MIDKETWKIGTDRDKMEKLIKYNMMYNTIKASFWWMVAFETHLQSNAKYLEQSLFLSIEPTKGPPPPRWSMLAGQFRAKTTLLLGEGVKRLCSNIFCTWL